MKRCISSKECSIFFRRYYSLNTIRNIVRNSLLMLNRSNIIAHMRVWYGNAQNVSEKACMESE